MIQLAHVLNIAGTSETDDIIGSENLDELLLFLEVQ